MGYNCYYVLIFKIEIFVGEIMRFLKKNWFKILIILPLIPTGMFVYSLEHFTGFDESLRFFVGLATILIALFILCFGMYVQLSTGNLIYKKIRFRFGRKRFGVAEVVRLIFSIGVLVFLFVITVAANSSLRLGSIVDNVTRTNERHYSLVVMYDFDVHNQGSHSYIGVLGTPDEEKEVAMDDFLFEQNYISNPVIRSFSNPLELMTALYDRTVTGVIVVSEYVQNFDEFEQFEYIEYDTVVLGQFSFMPRAIERAAIDPGEPFSILLLGLNTREEVGSGLGQINTFMLLTVNLQELSFTITSVPRDSFVNIPCWGTYDKLSHTNWGGANCAVGAIEAMFDIDIPYYVKLNFTGFMEIIDVLGGIEVDIPFRFAEQDSRRRFAEEHLIRLEAGPQRLNAEEALAFARHRNLRGTSEMTGNDFARVGHQQMIFQAMLSEMLSQSTSINDILPLLEVLGRHVQTNLTSQEIMTIVDYLLSMLLQNRLRTDFMDNLQFINMVILGDTPTINGMSVVLPWPAQIARARELMRINLGLLEPTFVFGLIFDGFNPPTHEWLSNYHFGTGILPPGVIIEQPAPEHIETPNHQTPVYQPPAYQPAAPEESSPPIEDNNIYQPEAPVYTPYPPNEQELGENEENY